MFKALIGDLFASKAQTLVNTVNCVGVMGKGIALEFKKCFPNLFDDYENRCAHNLVKLGQPYLYQDMAGQMVVNFPTKGHWRPSSKISDIESGLDYFVKNYVDWGITSIAFPPLGCGNGGLEWSEVGPLMYSKLHQLPIDVEVYAPYGTPKHELKEEYLSRSALVPIGEKIDRKQKKLNSEWVALIEVLRELSQQPYANPVGRTIFQKICYVLTETGVQTDFMFSKNSYGPFSHEVKTALHEFSNRNWLREEPLGKMMLLLVGDQYEEDRKKYINVIKHHESRIKKTVDLFSRIKSTKQAEEVITVLFAGHQLMKQNAREEIDEENLLDYILQWKKTWIRDERKKAVTSAIQNLALLGWMKLSPSKYATKDLVV